MAYKSQILNHKSKIFPTLPSKLANLFLLTLILFFISTTVFSRPFVNNSFEITNNSYDVDTPKTASDSVKPAKKDSSSSDEFKSKVVYSARDSIRMDASEDKVYLYGDSKIHYEDIDLKADQIMIDYSVKEVTAKGTLDTAGKLIGKPEFTETGQTFKATTMRYNFNTKKGKITYVTTKEGDGFVHGEVVKKDSSNNLYIRNGRYTTCDLDTPHYYIGTTILKIINKKRVVTGPAYLVIEDVPTPFAIPFGYFPNDRGRSSGIIIPAYGESTDRGFYFQKLGYYFGISDYVDAALTGDIYTKGSWLLSESTEYYEKYRYRGNFTFSYSDNITSEPELPDYAVEKDFHILWSHTQDPKANPGSIFSASVNAGTSNFYQNNLSAPSNYLTNTFNSSISYTDNFNSKMNLVASLTHSQDIITHELTLSAPNLSFNVARITPFQSETGTNTSWYNNIGFSYSAVAENRVETIDSLLFKKTSLDSLNYGMQHVIPISTSIKVFKYATLTPSITYTERMYPSYITEYYDSTTKQIVTDTIHQIKTEGDYIATASLATKLYGMYQFNSGWIAAIRHVMTPTIGFSYRPDYGASNYGIYRNVRDSTGAINQYSIFQNNLYGSPASGKYGFISFGLDNNLEMKVRTKSDTGVSLKKITIFDSFSINSGYNLAADSLNLADFTLNAHSKLFNFINMTFAADFDPYALDSLGNPINKFLLNDGGGLARLNSASATAGFSLNPAKNQKPMTSNKATEEEMTHINEHPEDFIDFKIPWNVTIDYSIGYTKSGLITYPLTQSARINGSLNLTSKWKIAVNSGYDFTEGKVSYTSVNIYRDMHCWEMKFNWIPFGPQESYNFQINVKASVLQDLKLIKKTDFYDNR